ncbi:GTP 3',8-cyclase MoaA [Devosia sp. ZB163]|uniref:GTP 3',8-cyclase MoaA n=1 Tax=Devosia sp. ZB163 TaxID=3025938 RepID=UPI00236155E0|nr:GTP 3',8-cyclase MoaA [Devosia sp. ZB163]MDC9823895.1 GTP 3',8-cyclase MoaA [Devosia sp. ZB163]
MSLTLLEQPNLAPTGAGRPLVDRYGRQITYLRVSVTDRCDFRCVYCMSEHMTFLPRKDVLSFEEIDTIVNAFVARGVRKVRLTGGEPLVRRDIMELVGQIGGHIGHGLEELTLTTNGSQLRRYADGLVRAGVRRLNVSLDTLDEKRFTEITRRGRIADVLDGIDAADAAGLRIKINMVAMRGFNEDEIEPMMHWAHGRGFGLTLIEGMPLGEVGIDRVDSYLPLKEMRDRLKARYTLEPTGHRTGGPARYDHVAETGGMIGFITPMSHNFCESCNRVRLTATGQLYLCLGQEDMVDLRAAIREGGPEALDEALDRAMLIKPKGHDFVLDREHTAPALSRHMSVTGG